jgi:transposase
MGTKMTNTKQQQDTDHAVFLEGASQGARRASVEAPSKKADPEVVAVARRRKFTPAYMQRIVREADACTTPGGIGELLRREGLYSSHLSKWRIAVAASDAALQSPKRGPKPDPAKAIDRQLARLQQENEKLRKQLGRAEKIIDVQKKLCDLLGLPTAGEVP